MNRLWFLYGLYFFTVVADVVTTHVGLQLWAVHDDRLWQLTEENLRLVWLWAKIGYAKSMLLKIGLAGIAGLCLLKISTLALEKPIFLKILVVFFIFVVIYHSYIVGTNVLDILKIKAMKEDLT